jgi:hypothetical protein
MLKLPDDTKQNIGLYYGAGVGFSINSLIIEAIYAVNNYSVSFGTDKIDSNCQTVTLYSGFKFE